MALLLGSAGAALGLSKRSAATTGRRCPLLAAALHQQTTPPSLLSAVGYSTSPPGGLTPDQVPQFVLFTVRGHVGAAAGGAAVMMCS